MIDRTYTNEEAARLLGLGLSSIRDWRIRGWLVERADGSLDVEASKARAQEFRDPTRGGFRQKGQTAQIAQSDGDARNLLRARAAAAAQDARWKQLRNAEKEGELIDRAVVIAMIEDMLITVKSGLEALPSRLPARTVGLPLESIRGVVWDEVNRILQGFVDEFDSARKRLEKSDEGPMDDRD